MLSLMLRSRRPFVVLTLWALTAGVAALPDRIAVGTFSVLTAGNVPADWEPMRFPKIDAPTDYELTRHDGRVVLKATSQSSASALSRKVTVDLARHPYLHWSWKSGDDCFAAGDWREPESDDFPLRLFVLFEEPGGILSLFKKMRPSPLGDAVLYLEDPDGHREPMRSSHLNDQIKIVPLSRTEPDGEGWDHVVRNVHTDYVDLFGEAPRLVTAIAVMTDTDNTATQCVSYFGDIYFSDTGREPAPR